MLHTKACECLENKLITDPTESQSWLHRLSDVDHKLPSLSPQIPHSKISITAPRNAFPELTDTHQRTPNTVPRWSQKPSLGQRPSPITNPTWSLITTNPNHLRELKGLKCGQAQNTSSEKPSNAISTSGSTSSTASNGLLVWRMLWITTKASFSQQSALRRYVVLDIAFP